jgi:hypothetical protein
MSSRQGRRYEAERESRPPAPTTVRYWAGRSNMQHELPPARPCPPNARPSRRPLVSAARHVGRRLCQSSAPLSSVKSCRLLICGAVDLARQPPSPSRHGSAVSRRVLSFRSPPARLDRLWLAAQILLAVLTARCASLLRTPISRSTSSGRCRRSASRSPSATSAWTRPASGSGAGGVGPTVGSPASSSMRRCVLRSDSVVVCTLTEKDR